MNPVVSWKETRRDGLYWSFHSLLSKRVAGLDETVLKLRLGLSCA